MLRKEILEELHEYIDRHMHIEEVDFSKDELFSSFEIEPIELEDYINKNRKPSFAETLFRFIDEKELKDTEVYKKAGLDRRHFSKIRSNPDYKIRKSTALALALALELHLEETEELLDSAGYSLSKHDTSDLIIQFFLEKEMYDIHDVNQALDAYHLKPL